MSLLKSAGLCLELRECVIVTTLPYGFLGRARASGAEADLLLASGERGVPGRGASREGASEVSNDGGLGCGSDRRYDLADSIAGSLLLDLEDVGDGVLKLH